MTYVIPYFFFDNTITDKKHGRGCTEEMMELIRESGCDAVGLQETRRSGQEIIDMGVQGKGNERG